MKISPPDRGRWASLAGPASPVPAASTRQRRTRVVRQGHYRGADVSRLTGDSLARNVSPVEQLRSDLKILRARARDLGRNDPLAKKYLSVLTSQVLGPRGPKLQAQIIDATGNPAQGINDQIEAAWKDWCRGPVTTDGRMNFYQFEQLCFRTMVGDGEVFVHPRLGETYRHGLALQGIDPDLVDETYTVIGTQGNEIWLGVEVDSDGARQAYHIYDGLYSLSTYARQRKRIEANKIVHCFLAERFNQARGVTWFAPAMVDAMQLNGYVECVLVGARAGAAQMAAIEQDPDSPSATPPEVEGGGETDSQPVPPAEMETEPGMWVRLAPGETLKEFTPNQPTDLFDPFTTVVSRRIATGLNVSYAALTGDFSKANYSSERAAQQVERVLYLLIQELWISLFRQPLFERWLEAAILTRKLRLPTFAPDQYSAVRWIPKGFDYIDPKKDLEALELELKLGLTSHSRALAERGEDFEEVLREIQRDRGLGRKYGVDLEKILAEKPAQPAPAPKSSGKDPDEVEDEPDDEETSGDEQQALTARGPRRELAAALNGKQH